MTPWPPFAALDLAAQGLLPSGWQADIERLADSDARHLIIAEEGWTFAVVQGAAVRPALPWLWALYHGTLRRFASDWFGSALVAAERLSATLTLNILAGRGARNDWHCDGNPVTGLLFATSLEVPGDGGTLEFRAVDGRHCMVAPRAGMFVCFLGAVEHRVAPLAVAPRRLVLPMNYYRVGERQPRANSDECYAIPAESE